MKKITSIAVIALFFAMTTGSAQSVGDKWPAIKNFHEVMSKSFHPTEEGNFAPLRANSESLMNKAFDLTRIETPKEFKTSSMMAIVEKLQREVREINRLVIVQASDDALKTAIIQAHDTFHEIVGLCSGAKH